MENKFPENVNKEEYVCELCRGSNCKLWLKPYGDNIFLLCGGCAAENQDFDASLIQSDGSTNLPGEEKCYAVGKLLPAIKNEKGEWGRNVPANDMSRWKQLPSFSANKPKYEQQNKHLSFMNTLARRGMGISDFVLFSMSTSLDLFKPLVEFCHDPSVELPPDVEGVYKRTLVIVDGEVIDEVRDYILKHVTVTKDEVRLTP